MKYGRHIVSTKRDLKLDAELHFIILSAGEGTRVKSYGTRALWEINHEPILVKQIKMIRKVYTKSKITVVVGFESEKIISVVKDLNVNFVENQLYTTQGQLGSVRLGLMNTIPQEVVIIHGDMKFNKQTIEGISIGGSKIITDSRGMICRDKVGVRGLDYVEHFGYTWDMKWAQIVYLRDKELQLMRKFCYKKERGNLMTYEALQYIVYHRGWLENSEPEKAKFKEINTVKDL